MPAMDDPPEGPSPPRFQMSLGVLMLLVAFVAVVILNVKVVMEFLDSIPYSQYSR
jgi:hypothetical protein